MTNKEMGVLTALYALTIQKPNEGCTVEEIVTKLQEDNLYKIGSTESYGHTSINTIIKDINNDKKISHLIIKKGHKYFYNIDNDNLNLGAKLVLEKYVEEAFNSYSDITFLNKLYIAKEKGLLLRYNFGRSKYVIIKDIYYNDLSLHIEGFEIDISGQMNYFDDSIKDYRRKHIDDEKLLDPTFELLNNTDIKKKERNTIIKYYEEAKTNCLKYYTHNLRNYVVKVEYDTIKLTNSNNSIENMLIKERDEFIKRSLKIFDDYFGRCYSSNDITNDHIVRKYIVSYDEIERFREKYPYGVGMPLKVKYGTREFDDNRKVQRRILNSRMDRAFNSNKLEIQKLTSILKMNVEVIELYEQKDREHNLTCDDIKMLSEKNM